MARSITERLFLSVLGAGLAAVCGASPARAQIIHSPDCPRVQKQLGWVVNHARREYVNKCENPPESAQLPACPTNLVDSHPFCAPRCASGAQSIGRGWIETMGSANENQACSKTIREDALAAMGLKQGTDAAPRVSTGAAATQASQKFKDLQKAFITAYEKDYGQNTDSNAGIKGRLFHTIWEINRVLAAPPLPATDANVPEGLRNANARALLTRVRTRIENLIHKMEELKDWANHAPSSSSYLYKAREEALQNEISLTLVGCPGDNSGCDHPHRAPAEGSIMGTEKSLNSLLDSLGERPNAPAPAAPGQGSAVSNLVDDAHWFMNSEEMTRFHAQWDEIRLVRHCRGMLYDIAVNSGVTCLPCQTPTGGGTSAANPNTPVFAPNENTCVAQPGQPAPPMVCVAENPVPPVPAITLFNTGGALTRPIVSATTNWSDIIRACNNSPGGTCVFTGAPANGDLLSALGAPPDCRLGWVPGCPSVGDSNPLIFPLGDSPNPNQPILLLPGMPGFPSQ